MSASSAITRRQRLRRCYFDQELDRPVVYSRSGFPADDPTYDRLRSYISANTELKLTWPDLFWAVFLVLAMTLIEGWWRWSAAFVLLSALWLAYSDHDQGNKHMRDHYQMREGVLIRMLKQEREDGDAAGSATGETRYEHTPP